MNNTLGTWDNDILKDVQAIVGAGNRLLSANYFLVDSHPPVRGLMRVNSFPYWPGTHDPLAILVVVTQRDPMYRRFCHSAMISAVKKNTFT